MVFNVSIGDFISVIDLVIQILGALDQSHGAAPKYQNMMATFESLKAALEEARSLDCNSKALDDAIKKAEGSIERFLKKIEKYQPSLRIGGSKKKWKDAIMKIKWALYEKGDVYAFREEMATHINSIQVLLLSACRAAYAAEKREILELRSYMMSADARLTETHALVATMNQSLSQYASQIYELLKSVFRTNIAILNAIVFDRFRVDIPMTVCWDQPVTFQDATGRHLPFNVGLINCWESFQHALKEVHKNRPGLRAIETNNYCLQNAQVRGKWSELDANAPFKEVFVPGGSIVMTVMVLHEREGVLECPKCRRPEGALAEYSKIECPNCDLNYSRSDYLSKNIYTFPAHFELPPIPVVFGKSEMTAVGGVVAGLDDHWSDTETEAIDEGENMATANSRTENFDKNMENVQNFQNIYITRPPTVTLRDHTNVWFYNIPWRIAQTFHGLNFIIEHYTASGNMIYRLRDRESNCFLNETNWQFEAWPGMVLLVEKISYSPLRRRALHTTVPEPRCLLCRTLFESENALRNHTASTHLSHRSCPPIPSPCSICAAPASAADSSHTMPKTDLSQLDMVGHVVAPSRSSPSTRTRLPFRRRPNPKATTAKTRTAATKTAAIKTAATKAAATKSSATKISATRVSKPARQKKPKQSVQPMQSRQGQRYTGGWWVCCFCRQVLNPALAPDVCTGCGRHVRCGNCYVYPH